MAEKEGVDRVDVIAHGNSDATEKSGSDKAASSKSKAADKAAKKAKGKSS